MEHDKNADCLLCEYYPCEQDASSDKLNDSNHMYEEYNEMTDKLDRSEGSEV